ncbi:aldose 1-epimerase [Jiella sp. MQZ9-1]|uniref:Aldose 1-epimerase n=1 Tax=Jiella flava TaxID=2816857 RepID=A0A939FXJ1_9HYPH|nr:aldose 1-epimerase [Jiella flava]MBO0661214.1 aldose 1-epimerase [Jiella flava]MCD2469859.1 aldose 1-epimerase [Jiella flava]
MTVDGVLDLRAGSLVARIAPQLGGAIVDFRRGETAIFRNTPPEALTQMKPTLAGSYAMIPFSNRVADARFSFGGTAFELARNFGESPHAIHGNGWQRAWQVAEAGPSAARLILDHDPAEPGRAREWPFAYLAEQHIILTADGLSVALAIENRDASAMPAGFGLHPYFDKTGAALRFTARSVWQSDARLIPTERAAVPAGWACETMREVATMEAVDHLFEDWGGWAEIVYPDQDLAIAIRADPIFSKLVVFRADERSFFAVEPVTHIVDAVNRLTTPDHGLAILAPGARLVGTVRFEIGSCA